MATKPKKRKAPKASTAPKKRPVRGMTTTRVAVIPGTGGVPYPTRSMDSSIEEALKSGLDEREVFPFG